MAVFGNIVTLELWVMHTFHYLPAVIVQFFTLSPMGQRYRYKPLRSHPRILVSTIIMCMMAGFLQCFLDSPVPVILALYTGMYVTHSIVTECLVMQRLFVFITAMTLQMECLALSALQDALDHPGGGLMDGLDVSHTIRYTALCIVIFGVGIYLYCKYERVLINRLEVSKVWGLCCLVMSLLLIGGILSVPVDYSELVSTSLLFKAFILYTFIICLTLYLHIIFYHMAMGFINRNEMDLREQLYLAQQSRFENLQKHIDEDRRIRHDFRHIIHTANILVDDGKYQELKKLLATIEAENDSHDFRAYCSNAAIDATLNYYVEKAQQASIKMDLKINLPSVDTVNELDICSVLGNLLENAIEGCMSAAPENRYLSLTIERNMSRRLYIVSTNSFDGKVRKNRNGLLLSTKPGGHGIGTQSIKTIAEKYHGQARFSNSENEFYVDIEMKL